MEAKLIPANLVNTDLGVVNSARVSLNKESSWLTSQKLNEADKKLIRFLVKQGHWTPFAHASYFLAIQWKDNADALYWHREKNPAGFQIIRKQEHTHWPMPNTLEYTKGSLIGWMNSLPFLPKPLANYVASELYRRYPVSVEALLQGQPFNDDPFHYLHGGLSVEREYLIEIGVLDIIPITLRIKVPIAIARQIRTSQVGFAYGDIYIENEAFCFNEVSRRYVQSEPEFYSVKEWRVREGKTIKQGSTGVSSNQEHLKLMQRQVYNAALLNYTQGDSINIAPEQLRFLLPQSMYTEFYMTGTVSRWAQFIDLRSRPDVQEETREIVSLIQQELLKDRAYKNYYAERTTDLKV